MIGLVKMLATEMLRMAHELESRPGPASTLVSAGMSGIAPRS